jgi:transcriptional regulator with GAF, ATPase, and Fis domain
MLTRGGPPRKDVLRRGDVDTLLSAEAWDASGCYVSVAKIRLATVDGSDLGPGQLFESERIVIGSHESADFVVRDPTVSRMHCELIPANGRVVIRDLESKNGTRVHGIAIKEATLTGTSILQLGHSKVRMMVDRDTANLPLFDGDRLGRLVGQSPAMRRVFAIVESAAASDASVLIQGEPGTGKEAVAATIHQLSPRRDKPMLVVDCGAIPREVLESELFGHEPGTVTGACASRAGMFEAANGGTVLLEDIGELPIDLQPKLLGVLERREVRRIGGSKPIPIDVRVMAATDHSLAAQINGHRFRSDLYYRIARIRVALPPLRSRAEDLPLLVADLATRLALPVEDRRWLASAPLLSDLGVHHWSGNLRELEAYLEACVALKMPDVIGAPGAPGAPEPPGPIRLETEINTSRPLKDARAEWMNLFDRAYATQVLRDHHGDIAAAARAAGTDRLTFCRLLLRLGMK